MLQKIDEAGAEIQVEAAILQVDLTDELQFGVQYSIVNTKILSSMLSGTVSSTGMIQSVLPGMIFNFAGRDASVIINALDTVTHVNVVSSPKVLVKSGEMAKVHFGQSVPILQEQLTTPLSVIGSSVSNQIVYRDTGITLNVIPTKLDDDLVELSVDENISDIAQTVTAIGSPVFDDRSIKTKVKIRFGQTVMLGGLIQQQQSDTDAGIPVLSRLPVLGNLFSQKDRTGARSEFVLLLTPRMFADGTAPTIGDTLTLRFDKAVDLWKQAQSEISAPPARQRILRNLSGL
jgi:general secretion pathway protein D